MNLADRMLMFRAKNNLTQQQLADKVGVSKQWINSIETGNKPAGKLTRAKIELVIGKEV